MTDAPSDARLRASGSGGFHAHNAPSDFDKDVAPKRHPAHNRHVSQVIRGLRSVAIGSLLVACTSPNTESGSTQVLPSSQSPTSALSPGPSSSIGEPIRLEMDLHDPPAEWNKVFFIPYGSSEEDLGILACSDCERIAPKTMAIDENGTIWIADTYKRRVVHYSAEGKYLSQARFQGAGEIRDLEVLGDDVVAVSDNGTLVRLDSHGNVLERGTARHGAQAIYLYDLFQAGGKLFAFSFGTDEGEGLQGPVELVDIADGSLQSAPGLPISEGGSAWVALLGHGRNRWYSLDTTTEDGAIRRRFRVSSVGEAERQLLVDVELQGVAPGQVFVSVEPLLPPYWDPVSPGTWFVSLDPQGDVSGSERISSPQDQPQVLVVGADARVYRMIYRANGIQIERM